MESSVQNFSFRVRHEILDTFKVATPAHNYCVSKPGST